MICASSTPVPFKYSAISFNRLDFPQRRIPVTTFTGSVSRNAMSLLRYKSLFFSSCVFIIGVRTSLYTNCSTNFTKNQVFALKCKNSYYSTFFASKRTRSQIICDLVLVYLCTICIALRDMREKNKKLPNLT